MQGILHGTFEQLHADGCIQTGADYEPDVKKAKERHNRMFMALMGVTLLNPCDQCPVLRACACFKKHFVPCTVTGRTIVKRDPPQHSIA